MNNAGSNDRRIALREASEWLVRLQDDGVQDSELEAWGSWMARSSSNARAFDDISALWDVSASLTSESIDAALAKKAIAHAPVARRPRRHRWMAAAAVAAACGVIAIGLVQFRPGTHPQDLQVLTTEKGQRYHIILADGSAADLDADSRLTVDFSGLARELTLERGRAHFAVAHDPSRPFLVRAGGIIGQALGTQFSMGYLDADNVAVVVEEGRVGVSETQAPGGSSGRMLEAGENEQIRFSAIDGLQGPRPVNATLAMSWREGNVVYQGERLAAVIEDLNRYSHVPLRLEDMSMGKLLVTGRWDSDSIDSWIEGLARALRLQVVRRSDVILLTARSPSESGESSSQDVQPAPVEIP